LAAGAISEILRISRREKGNAGPAAVNATCTWPRGCLAANTAASPAAWIGENGRAKGVLAGPHRVNAGCHGD